MAFVSVRTLLPALMLPVVDWLEPLAEWDRDYSVGYETAKAQAADLESFWSA